MSVVQDDRKNTKALAKLFTNAKKAVEVAESYMDLAKKESQMVLFYTESLQSAYGKLSTVVPLFYAQVLNVKETEKRLHLSLQDLKTRVRTHQDQIKILKESFAERFTKLKRQTIDPDMINVIKKVNSACLKDNFDGISFQDGQFRVQKPNEPSSEHNKRNCLNNLYDFVDETSVNHVVGKAESLISELKGACDNFDGLMTENGNVLKHIEDKSHTLAINFLEIMDKQELEKIQLEQLKVMEKYFDELPMPIVSHYDRLSYALNRLVEQQSVGKPLSASGDALEGHKRHSDDVANLLFNMYENLEHMVDQRQTLIKNTKLYLHNYQLSISVFVEFERYSDRLYNVIKCCNLIVTDLKNFAYRLRTSFEECENLLIWYENFEESFNKLSSELNRRLNVTKEYLSTIRKYQQHLETMYKNEVDERKPFLSNHSLYLPPQLARMFEPDLPQSFIVLKK